MSEKQKAISYVRDSKTRNKTIPYEEKFAGLIRAIAESRGTETRYLMIAEPWVIGDTYEELLESLSRLAGSDLALCVSKRENNAANN